MFASTADNGGMSETTRTRETVSRYTPSMSHKTASETELTTEEAARILNTTRRTICRCVERGALIGRKVRGKRGPEFRINAAAVAAMKAVSDPPAQTGANAALYAELESLKAGLQAARETHEYLGTLLTQAERNLQNVLSQTRAPRR